MDLDICHKKFYITRSRVIALRPLDGHCYKLYDYFRWPPWTRSFFAQTPWRFNRYSNQELV